MSSLRWPPKDPQETLDYSLKWEKELSRLNDAIFDSFWRIEDNDDNSLTTSGNGVKGFITYIWLSGGEPGRTYKLVNTINTDAGRIYERTASLMVMQR